MNNFCLLQLGWTFCRLKILKTILNKEYYGTSTTAPFDSIADMQATRQEIDKKDDKKQLINGYMKKRAKSVAGLAPHTHN